MEKCMQDARGRKLKKTLKGNDARKVVDFYSSGFSDYLAARVLINSGLLPQGAVLASTALEKYLKGVMAVNGNESHGHLKKAHWESLKNYSKELYSSCNIDFLKLCQKSYKLRYLDDVPDKFNLVIAQLEFLIELDKTVENFESIISQAERPRIYEAFKEMQKPELYLNNVPLGGPKSPSSQAGYQHVYEVRSIASTLMEIRYESNGKEIRPGFLREGLVTTDNQTFASAFPMPPNSKNPPSKALF